MVEHNDNPERNDELEQALWSALRPTAAPEGFADRVVARARRLPNIRSLALRGLSRWNPVAQWAIAAVLLVAVCAGGFTVHLRQRRLAGERARDQVLLALRITSLTIRAVRQQVNYGSHNNGQQQERP